MEKIYEILKVRRNGNLDEYRKLLNSLTREEEILLDLHLRKIAIGEIRDKSTGIPSLDKVWLKHYKEKYIKSPIPEMTAFDYLKKCNENNLDSIAIDSVEGSLSYKEFIDLIYKTAISLQTLGIKKGDIILGMLPAETAHEATLLYAASATRSAISTYPNMMIVEDICKSINEFSTKYFFIYDKYLTDEMEKEIYSNTELKSIVVINSGRPPRFKNSNTITWDDFIRLGKNHLFEEPEKNPNDLLFMAKTGGSTGKPKSVMLSDNSFNKKVHELINSDLDYNPKDKWLRMWPLFSASAAVTGNHISLCSGMKCILRNAPATPEEYEDMFLKEKPDHLVLIPEQLEWMEQSTRIKKDDLQNIKSIGVGGMIISEPYEQKAKQYLEENDLNLFLGIGYGQTENGPTIAMRMNKETAKLGRVGAPLVNTTIGIFDQETGEELGYDEEGEIAVLSHSKMIGYYNDQEKTKEVIKTHKDGSVWLHTNDLGSIDSDGLLKVTGRMTRFIFTYPALQKAYPDQIEGLLFKVPGVANCAVGALPYENSDNYKYLVAFVVVDQNHNPETVKDMIDAVCNSYLPEYARPTKVYIKDALPLLPSQKTDIKALEWEAQNDQGLKRIPKV